MIKWYKNSQLVIGTPSPTAKLHVTSGGNNSTSYTARFQSSSSVAGSGGILFDQNSTYGYKLYTQGTSVNAGSLIFDYIDVASGNTVYNSVLSLNDGNVGIGTSSPIARLDLISNSAELPSTIYNSIAGALYKISGRELAVGTVNAPPYATYFQSRRTDDNPNDLVFNPAGGNVGIGTTEPGRALHIATSATTDTGILVTNSAQGYATTKYTAGLSDMYVGQSSDNVNWNGTGSGTGVIQTTGNLALATPLNTPRLIITTAGNVGIGTINPDEKLHVEGSLLVDTYGVSNTGIFFREGFTDTQPGTPQPFNLSITTYDQTNGGASNDSLSINAQDGMRFTVNGSTEAMVIKNSGNVGIGTTTPAAKLVIDAGSVNDFAIRDNSIENHKYDNDNAELAVNYVGYLAGTNRFRTFTVYNGKQGALATFQGSSGNVGIGTTSPSYKLDVIGTIRGFGVTDSSDIRLKKDIEPLDLSLEKILKIDGVAYHWKDQSMPKKQIGFIAQQLEKVFPELIETDKHGMKSVNYSHLVAPLAEAIKSLYSRIVVMEEQILRKVASLDATKAEKSEVEQLKQENKEIKKQNKQLIEYLCIKDSQASFCNNQR